MKIPLLIALGVAMPLGASPLDARSPGQAYVVGHLGLAEEQRWTGGVQLEYAAGWSIRPAADVLFVSHRYFRTYFATASAISGLPKQPKQDTEPYIGLGLGMGESDGRAYIGMIRAGLELPLDDESVAVRVEGRAYGFSSGGFYAVLVGLRLP